MFDFTLVHVPGLKHIAPDALSDVNWEKGNKSLKMMMNG